MSTDLLNALPVPVMDLAPVRDESNAIIDFKFVWANEVALGSTGAKLEQVIGLSLLKMGPDISESEGFEQMIETIESGKGLSMVTNIRHGKMYRGKMVKFITEPSEAGCVVMMQDVTDVIAERDAARGQMRMMQAACDDAVGGVAIADDTHKLLYVNPALCKELGYTKDELLTMRIGDLMRAEESEIRHELAEKLLSEEISQYVVDRKYLTKSGEEILYSVAVSTIHTDTGEHLSLAHFRDVREERSAQAELSAALSKAEESTRMKSEFLANMSHEIRTPLNGVIGMAQVLAYSELSPQQAEHVAIIRDSGSNLMSLLNDILDLSKVEAGKVDINPIEVDLRHKLNRVYKLHEPVAAEKGIGLDFVVHPSLPARLKVDPVRLHQCVSNLVSNAVKFTSKGKVIIAITSQPVGNDQHKVVVHVSDTGIGIAADKLSRIFESFQQADGSTTRSFGGTGLGLTITRRLAQLMGGNLSVVSEEGRGSVFTLSILAEAEGGKGIHQERLINDGSAVGFSDCRVLIVDDNVINRKVASSLLQDYGFVSDEAVDGVDALEKLEKNEYDLVLMDVHMPSMDGITAAKKLREHGTLNTVIPIIALTADAMSGDRERYLALGMDGYVSKPIDERELIGEIGNVLTAVDTANAQQRMTR